MGALGGGCILPSGPTLSWGSQATSPPPPPPRCSFHMTLMTIFCLFTSEACIVSLSSLFLLKWPIEATFPSLLCAP